VGKLYSQEMVELDQKQNEMARVGTTHVVTIMNDFDLLPTHNFRYGQHPQAENLVRKSTAASSIRVLTAAGSGAPWPVPTESRILFPSQDRTKGERSSWMDLSTRPSPGVDPISEFSILHRHGNEFLLRHLWPGYDLGGNRHRLCHGVLRTGPDQRVPHRRAGLILPGTEQAPSNCSIRWPEGRGSEKP